MTGPQHKKNRGPVQELTARELHRAAVADNRRAARRRIALAFLVGLAIVASAVVSSWFRLRKPAPEAQCSGVPSLTGVSPLVLIRDPQGLAVSIVLVPSHP